MYPSRPGLATSNFTVLDGAVSLVYLPVLFTCYFFPGNNRKEKEMSPSLNRCMQLWCKLFMQVPTRVYQACLIPRHALCFTWRCWEGTGEGTAQVYPICKRQSLAALYRLYKQPSSILTNDEKKQVWPSNTPLSQNQYTTFSLSQHFLTFKPSSNQYVINVLMSNPDFPLTSFCSFFLLSSALPLQEAGI